MTKFKDMANKLQMLLPTKFHTTVPVIGVSRYFDSRNRRQTSGHSSAGFLRSNIKNRIVMKMMAMGKMHDVKKVINEVAPKCVKCKRETKDCVKLYRRQGSLVAACVELT